MEPSAAPMCVSPMTMRALWLLIMTFLLLNTLFLLALASAYFSYSTPNSLLSYLAINFLFSKWRRFLMRYHVVTGVAYTLVSVPFVHAACRLVWHSLRRRQLAFGSGTTRRHSADTSIAVSKQPALTDIARGENAHPNVAQSARRALVDTFSWIGRLRSSTSIDGEHFTTFILASQTVELLLQTMQGYRSSEFISNGLINQLYGIMIYLHCWLSSLIRYLWEIRRRQVRMARLLVLLVGILLSFTWGTVLQGCLFVRYWRYYQGEPWSFDLPEVYDRELRQLLVVSLSNFIFSTFPFVASGLVVHEICQVLDEESTMARHSGARASAASINQLNNPKVGSLDTANGIALANQVLEVVAVDDPSTKQTQSSWGKLNHRTVHSVCTMVFGVLILITSIGSSGRLWPLADSDLPCLYQLFPWFTSTKACVGRRVSCTDLQITGAEHEMVLVIARVEPFLLANLEIADCPALVIPSTIRRFTGLVTLQVTNSTVLRWDQEAAVTDPYFSALQSLRLHDIRMQCSPTGITAQRMPESFEWVDMKAINADSFIHDVGDAWQQAAFFFCNACGFHEPPPLIQTMTQLQSLVLTNDAIRSIPDSAFADKPWLTYIKLSGNPIQTLPPTGWDLFEQLEILIVEQTNIAEVPASAAAMANPGLVVWAYNTSLCASNATKPSPAWLTCEQSTDPW